MTIEKMHNISRVLDILGKTEHIFFMSKDEFDKEFDFIICQYPKSMIINIEEIPRSVETIIFDGITFYIVDPL